MQHHCTRLARAGVSVTQVAGYRPVTSDSILPLYLASLLAVGAEGVAGVDPEEFLSKHSMRLPFKDANLRWHLKLLAPILKGPVSALWSQVSSEEWLCTERQFVSRLLEPQVFLG